MPCNLRFAAILISDSIQTSDDVCRNLRELTLRDANTEQQAEDVRTLLNAISSLPQTTDEIHKILKRLEVKAHAEEETQILDWLDLNNPSTKHQTMRNARLAQTGQWIFDDVTYSQWRDGVAPIFWGQGKPGVGKSVLLYVASISRTSDYPDPKFQILCS